jgi:hypothetical protein
MAREKAGATHTINYAGSQVSVASGEGLLILAIGVLLITYVPWLTLETMGEVYGPLDSLSRPKEHGVLEAQVCHQPTLVVHHEVRNLLGGANPLQNPELEAVDVHRMRHAFLIVVDLPDLLCASLHHEGELVHLVGLAVDEPLHSPIVGGHRDSYGSRGCPARVQLWHPGERFRHAF